MAKLLKLRRGTTTQHDSFTGAEGEVTVDLNKDVLVVHDGTTQAGHPLAAEDMSNVSSANIAGRLATDSIATTKIAAGALPTDVTVTDSNISGNLTIATGDINNDAVTYDKIQNVSTTNRVLGRVSSGSGVVEELSADNVRTFINVENGATADQSNAEIRTAVEAASDSNVFTDADHTKLNGIAANATNVTNNNQLTNGASYVTSSVVNSLNASNLSSGTIPDARFPSTLPAISGANLTGITSFVSGMIIMYNNASAPTGWYLCDGNNGTPDLRDRFIVGAGNSYSLNATGGSNTATDTISISGSDTVSISVSGTTSASANNNNATYGLGQATAHARNEHTHTFSATGTDTVNISGSDTASIDTRSPYYALTFIMKA